jgi:hypothetical protein
VRTALGRLTPAEIPVRALAAAEDLAGPKHGEIVRGRLPIAGKLPEITAPTLAQDHVDSIMRSRADVSWRSDEAVAVSRNF